MSFQGINLVAYPIADLLQSLVKKVHAKKQYKHEIRIAEINLTANYNTLKDIKNCLSLKK